jgi:hypothetical protein
VISSISNWLTNRRIVWIAAAIAFLGFTGPVFLACHHHNFFKAMTRLPNRQRQMNCRPESIRLPICPHKLRSQTHHRQSSPCLKPAVTMPILQMPRMA